VPSVFEIGASLKEARNRRGLSAADVQKELRIREGYLTALEEERWDMLPGEAYAKGFLRSYAEFLGLNGNLYIDEYNSRFAHRDEEPLAPHGLAPGRGPHSTVLRALVGILVVGAAVAGLAAWRLGGTSTHPHAAGSAAAPVSAPVAPAAKPKAKPVAAAPATTAPVFAVVTAKGRSWIAVRAHGPNGTLLFQGFLDLGMTKRFAVDHAVWLRMGRPDVLEVKVAGHVLTPQTANPANLLLTRRGAQPA
jgi:cytoskeleton protein RodZ